MSPNVNMICKSGYYYLRNIKRIRKYLSKDSAEKLIHAFVTSRLDNCNSVLYGLPACTIDQFHNHVQNVQAVVLAGYTSCKLNGLYDCGEILLKTYYN